MSRSQLPETGGTQREMNTRVVGLSLDGHTVILESCTGWLSLMPRTFLVPDEEKVLKEFECLREI